MQQTAFFTRKRNIKANYTHIIQATLDQGWKSTEKISKSKDTVSIKSRRTKPKVDLNGSQKVSTVEYTQEFRILSKSF